jgi:hypothetical protein
MTKKRTSKSTLSMFLRTKCDRELYLSLHEDSELDAQGMPVPLQARPGIGLLCKLPVEILRMSETIS